MRAILGTTRIVFHGRNAPETVEELASCLTLIEFQARRYYALARSDPLSAEFLHGANFSNVGAYVSHLRRLLCAYIPVLLLNGTSLTSTGLITVRLDFLVPVLRWLQCFRLYPYITIRSRRFRIDQNRTVGPTLYRSLIWRYDFLVRLQDTSRLANISRRGPEYFNTQMAVILSGIERRILEIPEQHFVDDIQLLSLVCFIHDQIDSIILVDDLEADVSHWAGSGHHIIHDLGHQADILVHSGLLDRNTFQAFVQSPPLAVQEERR